MKRKKILYKMGELAKLCKVTPRTLQIPRLENQLHKCKEEMKRLSKRCSDLESLIAVQKKKEETADIYLDKLPAAFVASRYNYVDGAWNQKNPEKWLTIIQVPIESENVKFDEIMIDRSVKVKINK